MVELSRVLWCYKLDAFFLKPHIQFASLPNRKSPDQGTLDYTQVFAAIEALGWTRPLGAEYHPDGATENSLDWMNNHKP